MDSRLFPSDQQNPTPGYGTLHHLYNVAELPTTLGGLFKSANLHGLKSLNEAYKVLLSKLRIAQESLGLSFVSYKSNTFTHSQYAFIESSFTDCGLIGAFKEYKSQAQACNLDVSNLNVAFQHLVDLYSFEALSTEKQKALGKIEDVGRYIEDNITNQVNSFNHDHVESVLYPTKTKKQMNIQGDDELKEEDTDEIRIWINPTPPLAFYLQEPIVNDAFFNALAKNFKLKDFVSFSEVCKDFYRLAHKKVWPAKNILPSKKPVFEMIESLNAVESESPWFQQFLYDNRHYNKYIAFLCLAAVATSPPLFQALYQDLPEWDRGLSGQLDSYVFPMFFTSLSNFVISVLVPLILVAGSYCANSHFPMKLGHFTDNLPMSSTLTALSLCSLIYDGLVSGYGFADWASRSGDSFGNSDDYYAIAGLVFGVFNLLMGSFAGYKLATQIDKCNAEAKNPAGNPNDRWSGGWCHKRDKRRAEVFKLFNTPPVNNTPSDTDAYKLDAPGLG